MGLDREREREVYTSVGTEVSLLSTEVAQCEIVIPKWLQYKAVNGCNCLC